MARGTDIKFNKRGLLVSIYVALALMGSFVAYGLAEHRNLHDGAERHAEYYAKDAQNNIAIKCGDLTLQAEIDCSRKIKQAARKNQRDEYDLYSQRAMSLWTAIIGWMTVFGVALSSVGVYLIWQTFRQTQEAAKSTQDTLDIAIATGRAYFKVTDNVRVIFQEYSPDNIFIAMEIENSGTGFGLARTMRYSISDSSVFPENFEHTVDLDIPVKPEGKRNLIQIGITPPQDAPVFVAGTVTYDTLMKEAFDCHFSVLVVLLPLVERGYTATFYHRELLPKDQ